MEPKIKKAYEKAEISVTEMVVESIFAVSDNSVNGSGQPWESNDLRALFEDEL